MMQAISVAAAVMNSGHRRKGAKITGKMFRKTSRKMTAKDNRLRASK